jgi:hypothetical protein
MAKPVDTKGAMGSDMKSEGRKIARAGILSIRSKVASTRNGIRNGVMTGRRCNQEVLRWAR